MAKAKKEEVAKTYPIRVVTVVKKPTGKVYPNDFEPAFLRGKRIFDKDAEKKSEKVVNTTWGEIREQVINQTGKDKNTFAYWQEPKGKKLKSVTRTFEDGSKEITYFNPVRN